MQRRERGYGKLERYLRVPKGLDPDAVTASLTAGVLTLRIPMPEERKPRRIEISTNGAQLSLEQSQREDVGHERELAAAAA